MPKMICIECQRENGKIKYLSVKGHAESAPFGQDLVCSAVSSAVIGGMNALENPKSFSIYQNEKLGHIEIRALDGVTNHDYIVLDVICTQLKSIEETNGKYISIIEKGC